MIKRLRILFIFVICHLAFVISASPLYAQEPCPEGYTCSDTSHTPVYGNTLPVEDTFVGDPTNIDFSGPTGPQLDAVRFPQLQDENRFFSNREFLERALPAHLLDPEKLKFDTPPNFDVTLAHVGCGPVKVNDGVYDIQIDTAETKFSTTQDYNNLLLYTRFWQSIFVPGKDAFLKFGAQQPKDGPQIPGKLTDCQDASGVSLDATPIPNSPPERQAFSFTNVLDELRNLFNDILRIVASITKVNFVVKANIEQVKYMPGEAAFADQTVGSGGFLNFFKPGHSQFTKEGDQEETIPYQVVDKNRNEGVIFKGMSSFQSGKVDLESSIFPEGVSGGTLVVSPISTISGKLDFIIPYRDSSIRITDAKKQDIIKQVKAWKPDTLIETHWDTVVNASVANGINPAFTLAIWIEESAASSRLVNAASAFGCFPGGDTRLNVPFDESLQCFINFTVKEHPNDFVEWVTNYCGPLVVPICSNNKDFIYNMRVWYDRLVPPGTPGAAQAR